MAMGVVTDFDANDFRVIGSAPTAHAMPTLDAIAVTEPAASATVMGRIRRRTVAQ